MTDLLTYVDASTIQNFERQAAIGHLLLGAQNILHNRPPNQFGAGEMSFILRETKFSVLHGWLGSSISVQIVWKWGWSIAVRQSKQFDLCGFGCALFPNNPTPSLTLEPEKWLVGQVQNLNHTNNLAKSLIHIGH